MTTPRWQLLLAYAAVYFIWGGSYLALRFAVEGQWSTVPDAIGVGGVSKVYGESNVGGFTILGKVILTTARD